jgi:hypothetical protein
MPRYYAEMLALASLLLFAENIAALPLPDFEALPLTEAAVRALEGREHGAIERVERTSGGMRPPNSTEFWAYEQPQAVAGGCRRTVWRLSFGRRADDPEPQRLGAILSMPEAALANDDGGCAGARFARVNGRIDRDPLLVLQRLAEIAAGERPVEFACTAELDDRLCRSPEAIRQALASQAPFIVSHGDGVARVSLREGPGSLVTEVSFDLDAPRLVQVHKRIPAPF